MENTAKTLAPRTKARQARSMRSVERILEAADTILRRDGPAAMTTPAIADEASISIGALYRYFPNKEAIIFALYEERLAHIRGYIEKSLQTFSSKHGQDWKGEVHNWVRDLRAEESRIGFDITLFDAIDHYPALAAIAEAHLQQSTDLIVAFLQKLGSNWPQDALYDLAVHLYFLNAAAWRYSIYAGAVLPQGTTRLAESMIALIEPALISPPPAPPYAKRYPLTI